MPLKNGRLTPAEKTVAEVFARTGDKDYARHVAKLSPISNGAVQALARPEVQAEIRRQQVARLFQEALPAAVQCMVSIITDSKAPAGARVQASKVVFDRTLGAAEGAESKEPHEMTSEEIAKAISQLEAVAMARAKPVNASTIVENAQEVRKEDDIFQ